MAAPSMKSSYECFIHVCPQETTNKLCQFTEVSWGKATSCARRWAKVCDERKEKLIAVVKSDEFSKSFQDVGLVFYHRACYSKFTNIINLENSEKKTAKLSAASAEIDASSSDLSQLPLPGRELRSTTTTGLLASAPKKGLVLPAMCLICRKKDACTKSSLGKRKYDKLMQAQTLDAGQLRAAAESKADESILRHIRGRDCVAIETKYHRSCYLEYTRFLRAATSKDTDSASGDALGDPAFESFCQQVIEDKIINNHKVYRLTKLREKYGEIIRSTTSSTPSSSLRTSAIKERLQRRYPQLSFHRPSRRFESELVYVQTTDHGLLLEKLPMTSSESESDLTSGDGLSPVKKCVTNNLHNLYTAGMTLRHELRNIDTLNIPWPPTASDLTLSAAESLIPISLYNLLAWTIGVSDEATIEKFVDLPKPLHLKMISLLQDVVYLESNGAKTTPKALSLGLTVRHLTRSTHLINILNHLGHCASRSTILSFETALAQLQLSQDGLVPTGVCKGEATLLVWDNIDFGEETVSGSGTTHHTNGILIQQTANRGLQSFSRPSLAKKQHRLEVDEIPIAQYIRQKRTGPKPMSADLTSIQALSKHISTIFDSLFVLMKAIDAGNHNIPNWTGFNTLLHSDKEVEKSTVSYLPVIEASPTELSTVNTILERSVKMADELELAHIVVTFDQAIYAKAQEIRWSNETYMQRLVLRLGEFHTSMSFLSILGKRFRDAGLFDILIEAGIVAHGSVNGVIEGKHYNRAVRAHKVMFEALERLRFQTFLHSLSTEHAEKVVKILKYALDAFPSPLFKNLCIGDEVEELLSTFYQFVTCQCESSPTFSLWTSYIDMVRLLLQFIRATRESDWELHLSTIRSMLPWYFAYDKTHYSRYLPAYWVEMMSLPDTHPQTYESTIMTGAWTVQQQSRYGFSATACDQVIEQTFNRDCKTGGGLSGITLNRNAVQRWVFSQSERAAIARQCEALAGYDQDSRSRKDLDHSSRANHEKAVSSVMECIQQMINPFSYESTELVGISSGVVAGPRVREDLLTAEVKGENEVGKYITERIQSNTVAFHDPIRKLKLETFSCQLKMKLKHTGDLTMKSDRNLFAKIMVLNQNANINLKDIFSYSLGPVSYPLANTTGSMAKTNKASIMHHIESLCTGHLISEIPRNAALIVDLMSVIHALSSPLPFTFGEFARFVLKKILRFRSQFGYSRIDIICDQYPEVSIKAAEHSRRYSNKQQRQIYSADQKIPTQWKSFIAGGANKEALVEFMFREWCKSIPKEVENVHLYVAHGNSCHCIRAENGVIQVTEVEELRSDHEEADTRLALHAFHAAGNHTHIIIRSPDTDVFIILLSCLSQIPSRLYFLTGTRDSRLIDLGVIAQSIGMNMCQALIGLHVFTGCDSVSAFHGKGKKKAYTLTADNHLYRDMFTGLGQSFSLSDDLIRSLETFVCDLYSQHGTSINDARYRIFCTKAAVEQSLPPTLDALRLHSRRANYQAAIHRRSLNKLINAPRAIDHGWCSSDSGLEIQWMTKEPVPQELLQHLRCSCQKKQCDTKKCSCRAAQLSCSEICACKNCGNKETTAPENSVLFDADEYDDDDD